MKKILSAVAALGFVAGVATTAAALDLSVSGTYSVTGNYLSSGSGQGIDVTEATGTDNKADSYWMHTFAMKPTMTVNDKITMFSEVRLADNSVWGGQTGGDTSGVPMWNADTATGDVYVHRLYMQYLSPLGKIQMGRLSSGPWGTPFLDNDGRANGIKFWPSALASGPWSTYFSVTKGTEKDSLSSTNVASGNDSDTYEGRVYYKDDALNAGVRYAHNVNNSATASNTTKTTTGVYGVYKWSNYFFATEIVQFGGDTESDAGAVTNDLSAAGALFEIGGQFDNLSVAAAYVYAEGDNNSGDTDATAFLANTGSGNGTGSEFTPLYILTGRGMGCLNADIAGADGISGGAVAVAGTHALAIIADYKASDRLTLHGAIAYAQADEEVDNGNLGVNTVGGVPSLSYANRGDEYGWEYDLGAAYKLLDNLTYEAHFGYLDTGDFFNATATSTDATNVYLLSHSLTMTF